MVVPFDIGILLMVQGEQSWEGGWHLIGHGRQLLRLCVRVHGAQVSGRQGGPEVTRDPIAEGQDPVGSWHRSRGEQSGADGLDMGFRRCSTGGFDHFLQVMGEVERIGAGKRHTGIRGQEDHRLVLGRGICWTLPIPEIASRLKFGFPSFWLPVCGSENPIRISCRVVQPGQGDLGVAPGFGGIGGGSRSLGGGVDGVCAIRLVSRVLEF